VLSAAEQLAAEIGVNPTASTTQSPPRTSMFQMANAVATVEVLQRLGIQTEETPRGLMAQCPGCGEPGALVCQPGGLKCLHNRCAKAGPPSTPGFRTNVDLVALRENLRPAEAAELICEWFGIEVPKAKPSTEPPSSGCDDEAPGDRASSTEAPGLPFLWVKDFGDLMKPPKLRWLFRDIRTNKPFMRAGKCYVLSADGGVGKGFFTLQTAVSLATGRDLFNAFRPEQSGRVALLVGEDDQPEIHHRLYRIANALGLSDLEQVRERIGIFPLSGKQVNLLRLDEARNPERTLVFTTLLNQLNDMAKQGDFEWSLVSIDPLSRFGGSTVETDQNMATAFVAALEHLAEQLPGMPAVQVSHHSSAASVKSGRANVRGVSGLRDAFRLALTLDAFQAGDVRGILLRNDKNNLAPEAPPIWLVRLENEPIGSNGRYIEMAGVLRPADDDEVAALEAASGTAAAASRAQREQAKTTARQVRFAADVDAVWQCLPEPPASMNRDELLGALSAVGRGCSPNTLAARVAELQKAGRVVDLSDGRKSSARKYARAPA
jgi:hypothetical protein